MKSRGQSFDPSRCALEGLNLFFVDFGLEVFGQTAPAILYPRHGKENLAEQGAFDVIDSVQHPHGNITFFPGFHVTGFGIVIIEPGALYLEFALVIMGILPMSPALFSLFVSFTSGKPFG